MIRLRGTVEYVDGTTAEYSAGSIVFVLWERYCRRQELEPYEQRNANTLNAFVAHAALHIEEGFDKWLEGVLDVDSMAAAEAVPPTHEVPSLASISNSPSPADGD